MQVGGDLEFPQPEGVGGNTKMQVGGGPEASRLEGAGRDPKMQVGCDPKLLGWRGPKWTQTLWGAVPRPHD